MKKRQKYLLAGRYNIFCGTLFFEKWKKKKLPHIQRIAFNPLPRFHSCTLDWISKNGDAIAEFEKKAPPGGFQKQQEKRWKKRILSSRT